MISTQLAKAAGARVVVTGMPDDDHRLELASEFGAVKVVDILNDNLKATVLDMTDGEGADIFIEASGSPAAVRTGLEVTRRRGQYLQLGLAGGPFELDFSKIAYKEIAVFGSLGQKWTAWERALKLLESGQVVTEPLITDILPLTEWKTAFAKFRSRDGIKIVMTPGKS